MGTRFWIRYIDRDFIHISGGEGSCCIQYDIIFKYFVKIREYNPNRKWTSWVKTKSGFSYRTDNERYTEVKKDGYNVKSACHPMDEFNLAKGIAICLQKVKDKKEIKSREKDPFLSIKSSIVYMNDIDSLDILFDSSFDDFVWAHFVAPGVYLKMKTGTDKVVGVHIDGFSKKLRLI